MNYLMELKLFYDWLETHELSANGIALWHAIMQMASRSGWQAELELPINKLMGRSSLSRTTFYKQREILRKYGLIDYRVVGGSGSAIYEVVSFVSAARTLPSAMRTQNDAPDEFASRVASRKASATRTVAADATLCSDNKTKLDNTKRGVGNKKDFSIDKWLSTLDSPWRETMQAWLAYKTARHETYRTEVGAQKCLTMLQNLSGGNERTAQQIIDQSMANNWAGLFALRTQPSARGQPSHNQPAHGQHIGQIKQPEGEQERNEVLGKFKSLIK